MSLRDKLMWAGVVLLGTISFCIVALTRGEPVNAAWLVVAAVCIYFIAYRFYALFITSRAFRVDPSRQTPAWRHDGLTTCRPTAWCCWPSYAAIAGAGPLVGLTRQMGYLPARCGSGGCRLPARSDMTVLFLHPPRRPLAWRDDHAR
jgi:carbon starvation protein